MSSGVLLASYVTLAMTSAVAGGSAALHLLACYERLQSKDFFALLVIILMVVVERSALVLFFYGEAPSR